MMLVIDVFVYNALAWYIGNIVPGKYGIAKPWYFIFMVCIYYVIHIYLISYTVSKARTIFKDEYGLDYYKRQMDLGMHVA